MEKDRVVILLSFKMYKATSSVDISLSQILIAHHSLSYLECFLFPVAGVTNKYNK